MEHAEHGEVPVGAAQPPEGVEPLEEWKVCRLSGGPLTDLAALAPAVGGRPPAWAGGRIRGRTA